MTDSMRSSAQFARKDLAEIAIGACVLAFPVAATEEIWDLSEQLSLLRVLLFAASSLTFLGILILFLHHREGLTDSPKVFFQRVLSTYFVTLVIAALLLLGLDRFDLFEYPWVSLKRSVLVAFPASFAATVFDSVRD